jgi:peroxiredoxin
MWYRSVIVGILLLGLLPLSASASLEQTITTSSGRMQLSIPDTWVYRYFPEEEEIFGLDSESLVLGTSFDVIDEYLAGQRFDGSVMFLSAYPYHVFLEEVLGNPVAMLGDVTVFDLSDITRHTYAGLPSAEFYYSEPDNFWVREVLFDAGDLAYRATVYSTRFEDEATLLEVFDSLLPQSIPPEQALDLNQPQRKISTEDERLSFQIPTSWLYWNEGRTSLAFASSGLAYRNIAYGYNPQSNPEAVILVQRVVTSALRAEEVRDGQADLVAVMERLRDENGGLAKNSQLTPSQWQGLPTLESTWLVQGEKDTVLTRTRLLDMGDSVYIIQAQYASKGNVTLQPMIEALFASISYQPFDTPLDPQSEGLEIGQTAPDFTLNNLEGQPVNLSDYRGKVVLMNMWATWCGPCHREAPDMQTFYQEYEGRFEILAVNIAETRAEAQGFVDQYDLTFPVVLDTASRVADLYALEAYPTTYVLSREGVVIDVIRGSFSEAGLRDLLSVYVGR